MTSITVNDDMLSRLKNNVVIISGTQFSISAPSQGKFPYNQPIPNIDD